MENFHSLIKNQYLKHPPSRLSARYGFASLFVLTLLLIGFRYQLEVAEANLSLTHSVSNAYPDSGRTITHTSVITNNGPNDATNVIIKHNVSGSSIIYQSSASSGPVAGTLSGSYPNFIVTWAGISIPTGTSVTVVSFISILDNEGCADAMGEIVSLSETDQDLTNNKMTARICPKPTICQPISQPPGNVNIVNSSCSTNCAINGGTITAPSTGCPTGYTLEYRVNGGVWSTTLPTYSQTGPQQIIESRCKCNAVSNYAVYQLTSATTSPGSCPDTDGDEVNDCNDGCPNDINKSSPGTCGCGVADTDSDGDGTPNCTDGCPTDASKIAPGTCGCGTADTDTDGDHTPNCIDGCPNDASKIAPGTCGCGVAETDSDGDGTPNCTDGCPTDANKIAPGNCGCGEIDVDSDGDEVLDCNDGCPNDRYKTAPGDCGCGVADTDSDGDGTSDCIDACEFAIGNIPNFNTSTCNCNPGYYPTTTTDGNGQIIITACTPCPAGSYCPDGTNKYLCEAGNFQASTGAISCTPCPVGKYQGNQGAVLCANCPAGTYANTVGNTVCTNCSPGFNSPAGAASCTENDTDGDGTPDVTDGCPNDVNKIAPGACGCGVADTDSDNDGTPNCNDLCPNDANKTSPGTCGCGKQDIPNCGVTCPALPDADCDGVGNTCDVCPGGNDKIDNNNDGKPDCKYPPSLAQIISAWKCSGNKKVTICHKLNNKTQTLCVSYAELALHLAHGDYLGSCNNSTCTSSIIGTGGTSELALQQGLHTRPIEAHLYPNPAQDQVILEFNTTSGGKGLIEIIDITGKMIKQITSSFVKGTNNIRFDVNTLSSGLHFVRVKDQNNNIVILKLNKL